jgi:hypothetical protein
MKFFFFFFNVRSLAPEIFLKVTSSEKSCFEVELIEYLCILNYRRIRAAVLSFVTIVPGFIYTTVIYIVVGEPCYSLSSFSVTT